MYWRISIVAFAIFVAFSFAIGCGGNSQRQEDTTFENVEVPQENPGLQPIPVANQSGLPTFPGNGFSGEFSLAHTTSVAQETINGDNFLPGQESGDNNGPGSEAGSYLLIPGGEDELAYAVYGITGLDADRPVGMAIEVMSTIIPGGEDELPLGFWLGMANYTTFSWEWSGPYSEPQSIVLNSETVRDRYVNAGGTGDMYFAIVSMADEGFVTPENPNGLTGVQVNTTVVSSLPATDSGYLATKPHFALLESVGVGTGGEGGSRIPSELDPDTQYITLEWVHLYDPTAPELEALQYKVYRRGPGDANEIPIGSVLAPQAVYVDPEDNAPGIPEGEEGVTYTYYLRAHNDQGFTPFSTQQAMIPIGWQMVLVADVEEGEAPLTVNFDASATLPRPGFTIVRYDWNFDWRDPWDENDFPVEWQDTGPTGQYVYDWPPPPDGDFDAVVKVWDGSGDWDIAEVFIFITSKPVAVLNAAPLNGNFPLEVTFDASASHDPDNSPIPSAGIVNYEFDFGEGDGWEDFGEVSIAQHTYNTEDVYTARLRVTDDEDSTDITEQRLGTYRGDWWMRGHDPLHTGGSPFIGAQTNNVSWSYLSFSEMYSSPAVSADGTVYLGSGDDNLYAINPGGSLKWSYLTGGVVDSSPAIALDGTVYVGSYDNKLYAINPDGSLKWFYLTGDNVFSSPAIGADGTVYVGSWDYKLYAINPDGSLKWSYTTGDSVFSSPAIGTDGTVYVGSWDDKLYAFNPDGTEKWAYTAGGDVFSSPAIGADGTVYVGSEDGKLHAINPDGSPKWSYTTGNSVESSPAIGADGTVYVGSNDWKLYAINPDGSLKWSYTTGSAVYSSPAIGADGTVYVGSHDEKVYALNPDGSLKWSYTTGSWVWSSPSIGEDGTVYVGSNDHNLYAFGPD